MLKAKYPMLAFEDILRYNFWNIVFEVPKECDLNEGALIEEIPKYSFSLLNEGRRSFEENGLLTMKQLLVGEEKDKRPRYTEEELKIMLNLVLLTAVYRDFKAIEKKKKLNLIDHMVRNQLKYSTKVAKFCWRAGEHITSLKQLLEDGNEKTFKGRVVKWLREAQEKW